MKNFELAKQLFLDGLRLFEQSRPGDAEKKFQESLQLLPNKVSTLLNLSAAQIQLKKFNEAAIHLSKVIRLDENCAEAYLNLGLIEVKLKKFESALQNFQLATNMFPNYAEAWSNKGNTLTELKRFEEAIAAYDRAIELNPNYAEAWSNKGNTLTELKRFEEAIAAYDRAIELNPNYAEAWSNKGNTLTELKRFEEAIAAYDRAIELNPNYAEAWSNKGNTLTELKRFEEAIAAYDRAIELNPEDIPFLGNLLHSKMAIAQWDTFDSDVNLITEKIKLGQDVSVPFPLLSLVDNPSLHLESAKAIVIKKFPHNARLSRVSKKLHSRIRVAYFSPDFRGHPVSALTVELFEIHNRNRFETFAFSLQSAAKNDPLRLRLLNAFDHFFDVENKSDLEIAQLAQNLEIDIAVNLGGHTQNGRMGIFANRAAPIQVNYLGYPGTLGANYIDYIIGDKIIIPELSKKFYMEKVAYLPNSYLVDDSKRQPSKNSLKRRDFDLPEDRFIFCCFNNSYKINPKVIKCWASILLKTPESVFWISENNELFRKNLLNEFSKLGISSTRIIFAKYLTSMSEHLSRYRLADLFLDTQPFNAHTTAIDALKAGLPLLTLTGDTFASRVGSSLLSALDLPELITSSQKAYEDLAIMLCLNPNKLAGIKQKLANSLSNAPLFNTPLFTSHLEVVYEKMYGRYQAGQLPDHLSVSY